MLYSIIRKGAQHECSHEKRLKRVEQSFLVAKFDSPEPVMAELLFDDFTDMVEVNRVSGPVGNEQAADFVAVRRRLLELVGEHPEHAERFDHKAGNQ